MNVPVRPPDFDDERTLVSARQVVPLEEIDAKVRRKRQWLLGGAFAVAMILGAASALVASYLGVRNVPTAAATAEVSEQDVPPAPVAVVENTPSPEPTESPITTEEEAPKKEPVAKRQKVVKHVQEPV